MQQFIDLLEQMPTANIAPPTNTIGHIFRHEDKENFISYWLAFLLDPECVGSTEPMSVLLQLAGVTDAVDLSDVSIIREHTFEDKRRIDFFIETNSHVIGIENKIWSGLQDNQLKDYKKQLSAENVLNGRKLILILLYPQKNESLPVNSKRDLHTFRPVTYEQLVAEFRKIRLNIFKNLRAAVLMEDFIVHMEEYIMQKQSESAPNIDIWKFEANYQKQLEELKRELKNSKDQFKIYITNRMHTIAGHNEEWKTAGSSTYFQLYKTGWEKYQVHFELKKRTEYAPVEMEVALHTKELSLKVERNDALKNLEEEVKKYLRNNGYPENFPVDYDDFDASMNRIFDVLAMLVKEFTPKIDKEILASDQEYHRT